jgi:O-antigen/teichoic acid export membrane protein
MEIGKEVITSLRWIAIARFSGQIITWAITIIVIRLLAPSDYGLLAMAVVIMGLISLINEMGLGAAVVQKADMDEATLEKIFGLLLIVNCIIYALLFFLSPLISAFFEEPELTSVLRVVGIELLIMSFAVIPEGILNRKMDFRSVASIDFIRIESASSLTLCMAILNFGVWALVFGNLLGGFVEVIALNFIVRHWCKPRFSMKNMWQTIGFGGLVTTDRVLWYVYTEMDTFLVGKFLGKESLGFYSVAKHLASIPMVKISQMLTDVAFAAFSKIQHDRQQVTSHFLKSVRIMSFCVFPIFFGISSVAIEIVEIFLGEKWKVAAIPLQMLSIVMPLRMLQSIIPSALMGIGRPDINVGNQSIACIMIPSGVLMGLQWGLKGVCFAWIIVYPIYFLIVLKRSLPILGIRIKDYIFAMQYAVITSFIMYAAVYSARFFVEKLSLPMIINLCIFIVVGAFSYLALTLLTQRETFKEVNALFKRQ